jgi:hypothetical protein
MKTSKREEIQDLGQLKLGTREREKKMFASDTVEYN